MSLSRFQCDELRREACGLGVSALGFARAGEVDNADIAVYRDWLSRGCHATMSYLERYDAQRADVRLLLDGAATVIVAVFNYNHTDLQPSGAPLIARYAHGDDYHEIVRVKLECLATFLRERWGGETRVCVDTAPVRERYWAVKSGVGFAGKNGCLIVPGIGSYCFIGVLLTTVEFPVDEPLAADCGSCGACLRACPGKALAGDGTLDARRCLSYLTIEHRGEFPAGMTTGGRLYGCDSCQAVCPHNREIPDTTIKEFHLRPSLSEIDEVSIAEMTQSQFSEIFRHSAIKRTKLSGLQRNIRYLH